MKKKLIIFDMDGTLVDTSVPITKAINEIRGDFGLPPLEGSDILEKLNTPHFNTAKYFYNLEAYTKEHYRIFKAVYDKYCQKDIALYEGIGDLLEHLAQQNHRLCVATNAHTQSAKDILEHLHIDEQFAYIIGADEVKEPKPSPDMLHFLMQKFDADPQDTLFVGDSQKDLLSAQNADIDAILVDWGYAKIEEGTDIIKDMTALQDAINAFCLRG